MGQLFQEAGCSPRQAGHVGPAAGSNMLVFEEAIQFPFCMFWLPVFELVADALQGQLQERT